MSEALPGTGAEHSVRAVLGGYRETPVGHAALRIVPSDWCGIRGLFVRSAGSFRCAGSNCPATESSMQSVFTIVPRIPRSLTGCRTRSCWSISTRALG